MSPTRACGQGPIQLSLQHFQGQGIHSFSGETVSVPHQPLIKELLTYLILTSKYIYISHLYFKLIPLHPILSFSLIHLLQSMMWAVWEMLQEIFNLKFLDLVACFAGSVPDLTLDTLLV